MEKTVEVFILLLDSLIYYLTILKYLFFSTKIFKYHSQRFVYKDFFKEVMFEDNSFVTRLVMNKVVEQEVRPDNPVEKDFEVYEALSVMQQGLPAGYDYADYVVVPLHRENKEINLKACNVESIENLSHDRFKFGLAKIIHDNNKGYVPSQTFKQAELPQLLIAAFDSDLWNKFNPENKVEVYKPIWDDPNRKQTLPPHFKPRKRIFYKFNVMMFFQVKKLQKNDTTANGEIILNPLTKKLLKLLDQHHLQYVIEEGASRNYCGVPNAIIAGRFNDGVEKPKDPYSFYGNCLIGYDRPTHLGGSYLVMQQCAFDWISIHNSSQNMSATIGRNQIKDGSTIFSQIHCPRSHIRLSRVKDDAGNPINLHRESKTYVSSSFNPRKFHSVTNNISPQEGIFFMGYHRNPLILERIILNQLGLNNDSEFDDGLLNHFRVRYGNILYVPSYYELTGTVASRQAVGHGLASLCNYHQIDWLKTYREREEDEELYKTTKNPYFHYSRMGFLKKMSYAKEVMPQLNPPSPRIIRLLSKTFTLWQDTWYYDRRQVDIEHFLYFLNHPEYAKYLSHAEEVSGYKFLHKKAGEHWTEADLQKLPIAIRNGACKFLELGHIFSTKKYGCRGPVDGTSNGVFGANTFHLEPEDLLAGGMVNLSMGQGKHLIDYLTEEEKRTNWLAGRNLSAHSGVGHVVPHYEEIVEVGLDELINRFKNAAGIALTEQGIDGGKRQKKHELMVGSVMALLGLQQYFLNYAQLAESMIANLGPNEHASRKSLSSVAENTRHLAHYPPTNLHQGVQLVLSVFIGLHISGEVVSIGRMDYALRKFARPIGLNDENHEVDEFQQDVVDSFFIKVGEKVNFNRTTFQDHQKWGNLALGNNAGPYPQGASFNQWGQQLTCGGSTPIFQVSGNKRKLVGEAPFYNSITFNCLRASRNIPFNAPEVGLRVVPGTPKVILEEAAKSIKSGGAHPVLLNDKKCIYSMRKSGSYNIEAAWKKHKYFENGQEVEVPFELWNSEVNQEHAFDYCSDGCHEMLVTGRSWFSLGIGRCVLEPLQYVLNEGKNLLDAGPRFINGKRLTYRERPLNTFHTYKDVQEEFFATFAEFIRKDTTMSLSGHGAVTAWCPATLLNAFLADMRERGSDFYENGAEYKLFAPQYTGLANLINALWNIKVLVFETKETTLQEIRRILQVNWGEEIGEPFISRTAPAQFKERFALRCEAIRQAVWAQPKFGVDTEVTEFGLRISKRLSDLVKDVFENPDAGLLSTYKRLAKTFGTKKHPFGVQYMPGSATFAGFVDNGFNVGASFDGRKKLQAVAQDFSTQNFLIDKDVNQNKHYPWKAEIFQQVLDNYSYEPGSEFDPEMHSGAVLDFNIDENYDIKELTDNVTSFAHGKGPNIITITTCDRKHIEDLRTNTDRDLLRFRMGGWTEFGVSMFPALIEQHIRRLRTVPRNSK